jgi:hypothetical protein
MITTLTTKVSGEPGPGHPGELERPEWWALSLCSRQILWTVVDKET